MTKRMRTVTLIALNNEVTKWKERLADAINERHKYTLQQLIAENEKAIAYILTLPVTED